jgi:signal transduction histidine kinase
MSQRLRVWLIGWAALAAAAAGWALVVADIREPEVRILLAAVCTVLVALLAWALAAALDRERRQAAALRTACEDARMARQRAETAERDKSVFLAHTSHELRTPLNAIIGFSEILAREVFGPLDKRYREYSNDIHHSGQHLLSVVNNILDLAKVTAGRWELTRENFSLHELLDDIGRLAAPEATRRGIELKRDVPADFPVLYTDRRVLRQILLNLIANGIKFTGSGGVVAVAAAWSPANGITLIVLDTGIGIEPGEIDKVVEPFSNVSNFIARKQGGTGLGLPLCRAFIALLQGELTITSQPGEGTAVLVKLPAGCISSGPIDEIDATAAE